MKKTDFLIRINTINGDIYLDKNSSFIWNEILEEEENDKKTLSFNIASNATSILKEVRIGRKVYLNFSDKEYLFIISSISPKEENKEEFFEVVAEDYASFVFTRNNVGLNLDTFADEDYYNWLIENQLKGQVKDLLKYILIRGRLYNEKEKSGWTIKET